jgi:anti-sigma factor RsiW
MAFVYNEIDASERREFETHLQQCGNCRREAASFASVRESIGAWRDEVLTGFVPSTATPPRRSALAAFRQFFDLSPLWLQSAAVVLTLCVLGGLMFFMFRKDNAVAVNTGATYTEQDVKRLIEEALAKQKITPPVVDDTPNELAVVNPGPARPAKRPTKQMTRNRRPLSRAEREQLAADLRLFPMDDDLELLGDIPVRINHEEK